MKSFREYLRESEEKDLTEGEEQKLGIRADMKKGLFNVQFPTNMMSNYDSKTKFELLSGKDRSKQIEKFDEELDIISKKYDKEFKDFFKKFTTELEKDLSKISQ